MDMMTILKLALVGSIALVVLSIGLGSSVRDTLAFLREPWQVVKAMGAMFVLMPLLALGVGLLLPLSTATLVTLLAISVSPMPPIYPAKAGKLGGGDRYVMSLFVLAPLVMLVAAPLMLALDERVLGIGLPFESGAVLRTLGISILAPLALGLLLAERAPALAARLRDPVARGGMLLLLLSFLLLLLAAWPAMRSAIGEFAIVAMLVMIVGGLLIGHLLGGPKRGNRAALATATALRHPGIALPLAIAADPADAQRIAGTVLIYLLSAALLSTLYGLVAHSADPET